MRNFKRSYNPREVERLLKNNGWTFSRQSGSHRIYTNNKGDHVTIRSGSLNPMIFRRLVKEEKFDVRL